MPSTPHRAPLPGAHTQGFRGAFAVSFSIQLTKIMPGPRQPPWSCPHAGGRLCELPEIELHGRLVGVLHVVFVELQPFDELGIGTTVGNRFNIASRM